MTHRSGLLYGGLLVHHFTCPFYTILTTAQDVFKIGGYFRIFFGKLFFVALGIKRMSAMSLRSLVMEFAVIRRIFIMESDLSPTQVIRHYFFIVINN